jgi:GWxTD domain-containing protein
VDAPLLIALAWLAAVSPSVSQIDDWIESAEASFLTRDERRAWTSLGSDEAREEFKRRYWRRRDPTPATDRNEFQELILERVRVADERFGGGNQPGSRTARGAVYVVLGPPAIVRQTAGPLDTRPRQEMPGIVTLPRTALDTTGWEAWVYNREHNADVLKVLRRPEVEIAFVVEASRRDRLQRPGDFAAYREALARHSIVDSPKT